MKRVVIVGGAGRMGQALASGLGEFDDVRVVALVDLHEPSSLHGASYSSSLDAIDDASVDVVVDFSSPESAQVSAQWCGAHAKGLVLGTTGLSEKQHASISLAATKTGIVMAPNFSVGAVLSERFAAMAAPYFDRVEIVELHHDKKLDAPSGTSLSAARAISDARKAAGLAGMVDPTTRATVAGSRGAELDEGVKIHSVRLPGLVAHQEILFGAVGEGLTIRHDSFDRASYVHGVAIALRAVSSKPSLTIGLDSFIS